MDNLDEWEEVRVFGYILVISGIVIFFLGLQIQGATFGIEDGNKDVLDLLARQFKDIGTGIGVISGVLFTVSEGWRDDS